MTKRPGFLTLEQRVERIEAILGPPPWDRIYGLINQQVSIRDLLGLITPGPDIQVADAGTSVRVSRKGNIVGLHNQDGALMNEYAATGAGLQAALAAAESNDVVRLPPYIALDRALTVPSGVRLRGPSKIVASGSYGSLFTVAGSMEDLEIDYTTAGAGVAIAAPDGCDRLSRLRVYIHGASSSLKGCYLQRAADGFRFTDSRFYAVSTSSSATCYGIQVETPAANDGNCVLFANLIGHSWINAAGPTCIGIDIEGTQERCLMVGCIGFGQAQWSGGAGLGIKADDVQCFGCIGVGNGSGAVGTNIGLWIIDAGAYGCFGWSNNGEECRGLQLGADAQAYACRGRAEAATDSYGIWASGDCTIHGGCGESTSGGADFRVAAGVTASIFGLQFDTSSISGTLVYLGGDRRAVMVTSNADVSDPPTDAELDAVFGTPAALGDGFVGILDDNAAGSDVWLCVTKSTGWWYQQLTQAV